MPSREDLVLARNNIVQEHGPWTAHNIDLGQGVYTVEDGNLWLQHRAQFYIQLAEIALGSSINGKAVLDLGCLEGGITVDFARHGALAAGLEIRSEHLAKANFARESLGLENLEFIRGDMLKMGRHCTTGHSTSSYVPEFCIMSTLQTYCPI